MPDVITDLAEIEQLARARRDEFEILRYQLEAMDDLDDAALDAFVDAVAAPIVAAIDCTQCANCCRSLHVYVTAEDAQRLADGLHIPLDAIETRYINREAAQADDEWGMLRARPCAFLQGKLCSVYAQRPDACRRYPQFTPDFRWTLADTLDGAALCPIIYNVLSEIVRRVDAGELKES
ncbi:MAG: YkgJ family cysteine cluster protein [Anaerolineae bacterium]|nr:YkgJ family cysteine cluster protein [Anaerolineae bacterium]